MASATAFYPRPLSIPLQGEEWDRLPWLADEPQRRLPARKDRRLALIIALTVADALGSYWAGRLSGAEASVQTYAPGASSIDARAMVDEFARSPFGWTRIKPNAPY